jgi:hypothetical protein
MERLERIALQAMAETMAQVKASFWSSLKSAEKKYAKFGIGELDGDTPPEDMREKRAKSAMGTARRSLEAATEAAIAFDLLGDVKELIEGTAAAVKAEFEIFFAEQPAEQVAPVQDDPFLNTDIPADTTTEQYATGAC